MQDMFSHSIDLKIPDLMKSAYLEEFGKIEVKGIPLPKL
jgi:hypothetical protein